MADNKGEIYIADGSLIRKLSDSTVTTVSGSFMSSQAIDGPHPVARFLDIKDIAVDSQGNLFVIDQHRIRKISLDGSVTTVAGSDEPGFSDGPGNSALFNSPTSITTDKQGRLYIIDALNHKVRVMTPGHNVTTLVGNGPDQTPLGELKDIAIDSGNNLYLTEPESHRILKIKLPS